jgi:hypothetical protein
MGKGPELLATALAVGSNADVHELAGFQSVRDFASRLGITTHFLPGLAKRLRSALTTGDPAIGFLGTALEYGVSPAPHEDRNARFLEGLRLHADVFHVVMATVERHLRLGPQLAHDGEVFPQPTDALLHGDAQRLELVVAPPKGHSQDEAATGEIVQGGRGLGHQHGITQRKEQD